MINKVTLASLLLLGYSLCWVSGTEVTSNRPTRSGSEQEDQDDSAVTKLLNITTMADFFSLLVTPDGDTVTENDVYSNYTDDSGAVYINAGGRMAQPDDCSPRDTSVRLPFDSSNPNVVYFPRCTKIERCGGCCASTNLECVPSYTERVTYKVVKAEVPYAGSSHLEWKGEFSSVILERHVNCRVQCTLTPDKCGPKKEFLDRQCECKCKEYARCQPPHIWDPQECECKCAEVLTCCTSGENCGLVFIKETCECGVDNGEIGLISNNNIAQEEMDAYYAERNNPSDTTAQSSASSSSSSSLLPSFSTQSSTPLSVATTRTTTETATGAPTTESDPCSDIVCPPSFIKQIHHADRSSCSCRRRSRTPLARPENVASP
jgi:hypothetical protein